LRLHAILQLLDGQGWSTSFIPDDGRASSGEIAALGALGCETSLESVPAWLRRHGHELHAVILCRHTVAGQYAELVRRHAPRAKLLFDTVDLHFLREQRAAEHGGSSMLAHQAAASQRSELALIARSDVSFVVSPHEKALLAKLLPQARVELLSNIHPVHGCGQTFAGRADLLFIGGYGHPPNSDAIRWIASEILPRLRQVMPDIRLHVFGDMPDTARRELGTPGLELHGRVADLTPWMDSCLASLAPLRFGAGVKGKINLSMSHGLPVIATTIAVEGMQLSDGINVLIADDATAFADAVQRLAHDEALWRQLSEQGLDNVRQHFSADAADAALHRVLD
jgi:hypothetical protein